MLVIGQGNVTEGGNRYERRMLIGNVAMELQRKADVLGATQPNNGNTDGNRTAGLHHSSGGAWSINVCLFVSVYRQPPASNAFDSKVTHTQLWLAGAVSPLIQGLNTAESYIALTYNELNVFFGTQFPLSSLPCIHRYCLICSLWKSWIKNRRISDRGSPLVMTLRP